MKNKINFKTLFVLLFKFIVFLICLVIIWKILALIKPQLIHGFSLFIDKEFTIIENIVSAFLGLLDLAISTITTSVIESIFTAQQDFPRVFIFSPQGRNQNISGVKTRDTCKSGLCVKFGNRRSKFRIVYAKIQNTGKSIISECSINGQILNIILAPGQSKELYFVIYEADDFSQADINFKFPYCIRDDQGNTYVGKYGMKVDYSRSIATFRPIKKMKRSILKNALSNL